MKTDTTQYEFSHGRKPKGRGMWVLDVTGTDGRGAYTSERYMIAGTLANARKEAARRLKQECSRVVSITLIEVLP